VFYAQIVEAMPPSEGMERKIETRRKKMQKTIRQETLTLPYFNEDVPVLSREDEAPYIPVVALCRMLGIQANTRIQHWRKLLIWEDAQKLPLHIPNRGTYQVWCIPLGAVPFLLSYFNWSLVSPERRVQLRQMTETSMKQLEQARLERTTMYHKLRPLLFLFLTKMDGTEDTLLMTVQQFSISLDEYSRKRLEVLANVGSIFLQEVTASARNMLHELGKSLIVDAVQIDIEGKASDTFSLPLFPTLPSQQEIDQFLLQGQKLLFWYEEYLTFLAEHGFPRTPLIKP